MFIYSLLLLSISTSVIEIEGRREKVCVREREREVACVATLLSLFIEIDKEDKILVSRKNFR